MPEPFLADEQAGVALRPIQAGDLPILAAWRNRPDIRMRTREFRPLSAEHQARWWARITADDTRVFMFGVLWRPNKRNGWDEETLEIKTLSIEGETVIRPFATHLVGAVGFCHWSPVDRTAEISFYLGEPGLERHGIMTAALRLLHTWGFESLDLARIWAEVYAFNAPALVFLMKIGYQEEGRLRSHVYRGGQRWDSVMLGFLREEWRKGP